MDKTRPAVETKPLNRSNPSYIGNDARVFSDPEGLRSASLHHLIEMQAHKTPNAIAIIHKGKGLSYQALNESANQLAHYLVTQGAKAERLVGISLVRSPEMIVAFLGVLKAGAAYVPIDPNYPESRRQYILADAQVEILLTQTALLTQLATEQKQVAKVLCLDRTANELAAYSTENPSIQVDPEQLA